MSSREILARRFRLVVELYRAPRGIGAVRLAEKLGVSRPTVDRDLTFLRREVGLPVEKVRRTGEIWHQLRDLPLANVTATPLQVAALRLARRTLDALAGTALVRELDQTLELLPEEAEPTRIDLAGAPPPSRSEVVRTLDAAIADRRRVDLRYRVASRGGAVEQYLIDPVSMRWADGDLYLLGFALNRGAARTFKVVRIVEATVLDVAAAPHPELEGEERFRTAVKAWSGEVRRVRVRLAPRVAWLAEEYPLVSTQRLVAEADGAVVVEAEVAGLVEVSRWVLGWGACAKVLEPPDLEAMVREDLAAALAQYPER
jgi:predicted DNA-binding transcriptional regulator YafY